MRTIFLLGASILCLFVTVSEARCRDPSSFPLMGPGDKYLCAISYDVSKNIFLLVSCMEMAP